MATPADVPRLVELVRALAAYEEAAGEVELTPPLLAEALFGEDAVAGCHVAEVADATVVAFALWYRSFSTWTGRPGLYLEDLFVEPGHRAAGHGRALLEALAAHAVAQGWRRLEWWVLDWNEPAIGFYRRLGARPMDEWTTYRVTGEELERLAAAPTAAPPR